MKSFIKTLSLLSFLFLIACSSDSSTAKDGQKANAAVSEENSASQADNAVVLSQEAPTSRIEFADGTDAVATYLINSKNPKEEMVEPNGLSHFEAHIANMISITSGKCLNQGSDKVSFVLVNNENILQGRYDLPCSYARKVYSTLGAGKVKDFNTSRGGNTEMFTTNQLNITANNLAVFKNIAAGLEPVSHNGIEIGQPMK